MKLSDVTGDTPAPGGGDKPLKLSDVMGNAAPEPVNKDLAALRMEQPELAAQWGLSDTSKEYNPTLVPLTRDQSGSLKFTLPEVVAAPLRGLFAGGLRAAGVGEKGLNPLRPVSGDILAATASSGASPVRAGIDTSAAAQGTGTAAFAAERDRLAALPQQRVEQKAARQLSEAFQRGIVSGGPTAMDAIEKMTAARAEKQPLVLADIENPELKALLGTVYRQGGPARAALQNFFETRNAEQTERVKGLIGSYLSDGSVKDTAAQLILDRSAHARPLWDEAMAGGSLAPLEQQFQSVFSAVSRVEQDAVAEVAKAEQAVTLAAAKQSQAGNVYASAGAAAGQREANAALTKARANLAAVQSEKEAARQRLQAAQADGSANAPGAVWSRRLQQFLDQPEVKRGISRGYGIERRKAVGGNRPFNPHEYAITGFDESGNPVVGKVPNMRLLAVAKEGLDAIIESPQMKNPLTGKPTKSGLSYIALRDGLVAELDRLNPSYKIAREQWAGDTTSIRALDEGRHAFDAKWFTPEELASHVASLSDSDRQFFILGVADKLKDRLYRAVDSADKGRIINNEDTRMRVRPLFGTDEEATKFLDAIERERTMKTTPQRLYGGSQTAERVADDSHPVEAVLSAGHSLAKLFTGHPIAAIRSALRARSAMTSRPDLKLNEAIAQMATNPDILLNGVPGQAAIPWLPPVP